MSRDRTLREQHSRFILTTGLIAAVTCGFLLRAEFVTARRAAEVDLASAAELAASELDAMLTLTRERLETIIPPDPAELLTPAACASDLDRFARALPEFYTVFVATEAGDLVCWTQDEPWPDSDTNLTDRAWWDGATEPGAGFRVGTPGTGILTGVPVHVHTFPLADATGRRIGLVGLSRPTADYAPRRSADLAASIEPEVSVVDQGGRVVTGAATGTPDDPGATSTVDGVDARGERRLWVKREIPIAGWTVWSSVPVEVVRANALRSAGVRILFVLLLFATPVALAGRILRRITSSTEAVRAWIATADCPDDHAPRVASREVQEIADASERALRERWEALASEKLAHDRVTTILNNAVLGIYVTNPDGRIRDANPAMARLLGYEREEDLVGLDVATLYADETERRKILEAAEAGVTSTETEWIDRDGHVFPIRLSWQPWIDDAGSRGYEVIAEDLSERRELEAQLRQSQKLEAIGRLAGGVAHDFNNRLTVITGQAELLLFDMDPDAPARSYVESILESAQRSAELTSQLLAFSRRQANRPRALDLNEVVRSVLNVASRLIGEDIEVVDRLGEDATILADAGQIEQILLNLCTNARDAMPYGGRLTIATEVRSLNETEAGRQIHAAAGEYVLLTVADTGEGMDEETRGRIFEPFFTTKEPGKGTGLGLATVYGIVKQSGGHVNVFSWPGRGSTFEIWLPRAVQATSDSPSGTAVVHEPRGAGETVLVVEDEAEVREVVVRTLRRLGYDVLHAEDGYDALGVSVRHGRPIDLLITDILMPGMRGPEVARRLVERGSVGRVLFVTGFAEESPRIDLPGLPWDLLQKPFQSVPLAERVRALLDQPAYHEEDRPTPGPAPATP